METNGEQESANVPFADGGKNIGRNTKGGGGGGSISLASDDFSFENYRPEKGELQQLSPEYFDQIELLDNGVTWAFKTRFTIKKNHLVICVARNEIGGKLKF
jgi:hypothetical protein